MIRLFIHLQAKANLIPHCFIPLVCLFWDRSPHSPWLWESQIHRPPCNRKNTTRASFYTLPSPDKGPIMSTFARKRIVSVINHENVAMRDSDCWIIHSQFYHLKSHIHVKSDEREEHDEAYIAMSWSIYIKTAELWLPCAHLPLQEGVWF